MRDDMLQSGSAFVSVFLKSVDPDLYTMEALLRAYNSTNVKRVSNSLSDLSREIFRQAGARASRILQKHSKSDFVEVELVLPGLAKHRLPRLIQNHSTLVPPRRNLCARTYNLWLTHKLPVCAPKSSTRILVH